MKQTFVKIYLMSAVIVLVFCSVVSIASAADKYGLQTAGNKSGLANLAISSKASPVVVIGDIIGVGLSLLGVIFFILILYAGLKWMTALGAAEKAEKAKEMLENAAIGLVIVLAAYAIARFVFTSLGIGS